jgi:Cu+-exporting ATPase
VRHLYRGGIESTPGVLKATVNVATQQADVEYLPDVATLATLRQAVESTGYKTVDRTSGAPAELSEDAEQIVRRAEYLELRNRFIFAGALAAVTLILSMASLCLS